MSRWVGPLPSTYCADAPEEAREGSRRTDANGEAGFQDSVPSAGLFAHGRASGASRGVHREPATVTRDLERGDSCSRVQKQWGPAPPGGSACAVWGGWLVHILLYGVVVGLAAAGRAVLGVTGRARGNQATDGRLATCPGLSTIPPLTNGERSNSGIR